MKLRPQPEISLEITARPRAVTYNRVSTQKQQERELSVPDQINQNRAYCEAKGWDILEDVVEQGSATSIEHRPKFQDLIDRALSKPRPFDYIVVHSTSRFYRDDVEREVLWRRLKKNGVEVKSITQDFGEGPMAEMTRRIMGIVDELQAKEVSKHVKRAMIEAARNGWWMPAIAPYGYKIKVEAIVGDRKRRKLEIHVEDAETVRLIFQLCTQGDGKSGRMGMKKIVQFLRDHNRKNRNGKFFYTSQVEHILKSEYYTGTYWFNKTDSREKTMRPREEWVAIPIPQIITPEQFQEAQVIMHDSAPTKRAPRIDASQVLLTGIAICGACNGPMQMANGTSHNGQVHRYYKCSDRMRRGLCDSSKRTTIREDVLDGIVLKEVSEQLLTAVRVQEIVKAVAEKREAAHDSATQALKRLRANYARVTGQATKLIQALTLGQVTDDDIYKATYASLAEQRVNLQRLIESEEKLLSDQIRVLTDLEAEEVARRLRDRLADASRPTKKRLLRALVGRVTVFAPTDGDAGEVLIEGNGVPVAETANVAKTDDWTPPKAVHAFGREWLPGPGSNQRPTH